jgi:hypothetical protein
MTRVLVRLARRHTPKVWLLWAIAVLVLAAMPVALVDPAVLMLVLDPELVALIALGAIGMIRGGLPVRAQRRRGSSRSAPLVERGPR